MLEPFVVTVDGTPVAATIHRPADRTTTGAAVVLGHGLGAVADMGLADYAERFAAAGLVAVTFDYRSFGASGGEPRRVLDVGRQLQDWAAVLAAVRGLDGVDRYRVALWGTSFAGGHVFEVARRDGRVAAIVSQCPFTDGLAAFGKDRPDPGPDGPGVVGQLAATASLAGRAVADRLGAVVGRDPVRVGVYGPPGSAALLTAPDCEEGYAALVPEGSTFVNDIAARFVLQVPTYRPGRAIAGLDVPILVHVCDHDSVAPAATAARYAATNPRAEVVHLDCGHFDLYRAPWVDEVRDRQAAFLVEATAP